jgi:hypothetical protein
MNNSGDVGNKLDLINEEIVKLQGSNFRSLNFAEPLEERFEQDTAKERSYRLWLEGLTAIIALNGCLLVDYMLVHDPVLERVVKRTLVVTPVALLVNYLVRKNPKRWLREGSVGLGTALICFINLMVEGSATAATTTFG